MLRNDVFLCSQKATQSIYFFRYIYKVAVALFILQRAKISAQNVR